MLRLLSTQPEIKQVICLGHTGESLSWWGCSYRIGPLPLSRTLLEVLFWSFPLHHDCSLCISNYSKNLSKVGQVYNRNDNKTWFLPEHYEEQTKYQTYLYFAKGWMLYTYNTLSQLFLSIFQKWNMPVVSWIMTGGESMKGLLLAKNKLVLACMDSCF